MRKTKQFKLLALLAISVILTACGSTSEDMRLSNQGFNALAAGHYWQAEKHLNDALRINPHNPYVHLNIGLVYQQTERPALARQHYHRVLELSKGETAKISLYSRNQKRTLFEIAEDNLRLLEQSQPNR